MCAPRPLLLIAFVLVAVAGCSTTKSSATADMPPVTTATRSPDALRAYLAGKGLVLTPDGSFDPRILTRDSEGYTVGDSRGSLRVYEIDDAEEMAQAVRQIEAGLPFTADWSLFKGGHLVVVYVGGDASILTALSAVMEPIG